MIAIVPSRATQIAHPRRGPVFSDSNCKTLDRGVVNVIQRAMTSKVLWTGRFRLIKRTEKMLLPQRPEDNRPIVSPAHYILLASARVLNHVQPDNEAIHGYV